MVKDIFNSCSYSYIFNCVLYVKKFNSYSYSYIFNCILYIKNFYDGDLRIFAFMRNYKRLSLRKSYNSL